jgi:hypothetical protein
VTVGPHYNPFKEHRRSEETFAMTGVGLLVILFLGVIALVVAVVVVVVVIVLARRGQGSGAGPLERIHRDYRHLSPAEKQALLEFVQADLGRRT